MADSVRGESRQRAGEPRSSSEGRSGKKRAARGRRKKVARRDGDGQAGDGQGRERREGGRSTARQSRDDKPAKKSRKRKDYRKGSPAHKKAQARRERTEREAVPSKKPKTIVPEGATMPFAELGLSEPVAQAISESGYVCATPIQAAAIPPALDGLDVLGCAQTGTGKTAAFALPILSRMSNRQRKSVPHKPFVLMLAPTRELAAQIGESLVEYGRHLKLRSAVIFGGVGQGRQVQALERGVHVLVATPGRLIDLMDQGYIDLSGLDTFVVDEADRMLDMGFLPALKRIIGELPDERQSLFFSATISKEIEKLVADLLRDPVAIDVTPPERSVDLIEQSVYFVRKKDKPERLIDVLTADGVGQCVVFTRTKRGANVVAERLEKAGIRADALHGNKSQNARTRTLNAFRVGRVQVLVATDVAARGLDIDDVTHVINYELPNEPESYVHRIGRTGRAGATGKAVAFCDANEKDYLRAIEKLIGMKVPVIGEDDVGYEPPEPQGRRTPKGTRSSSKPRKKARQGKPRGEARSREDRSPEGRSREETRSTGKRSTGKRAAKKRRPAERREGQSRRSSRASKQSNKRSS